jgi:hypothetical protein
MVAPTDSRGRRSIRDRAIMALGLAAALRHSKINIQLLLC